MKTNIHPQYYPKAQVTCACGHTFTTGSTKPKIKVEICSACHPFFTGEMKYVDTAGRVDKFQAKMKAASQIKYIKKKDKKAAKKARQKAALLSAPKSIKEMMQKAKQQASTQSSSSTASDDQQNQDNDRQ